jgi:hypothetical protein
MSQPLRNLPKHERYSSAYKRFGLFWGLGVEHETYIATSQARRVTAFTATNMKPERYSVSYYRAYKANPLATALAKVVSDVSGGLTVPILMNCHSLIDCDVFGEHILTYEKEPKANPRYAGKTMYQWISEQNQWLRDELGHTFMWDGDTVEFMTQDFYCATVDRVMRELVTGRERFVAEMNRLPRAGILAGYGPLRLASPVNEPWATYLTNQRGVAMFNNGTIHINVTLPTRLGWNRKPLCWHSFLEGHRRLARLIQWMEPLWVACYGSGDPFAARGLSRFSAGSQRLAVSRYIGLGTYDTETMPQGKVLQIPKHDAGALSWYDWLHARTDYEPLDVIGLDLNFYKHHCHGLELRFFDQMDDVSLRAVMEDLVVLMDVTLATKTIPNPRRDVRWQRAAGEALLEGRGWRAGEDYLLRLCEVLGLHGSEPKEPRPATVAMRWLRSEWMWRRGACWRLMCS